MDELEEPARPAQINIHIDYLLGSLHRAEAYLYQHILERADRPIPISAIAGPLAIWLLVFGEGHSVVSRQADHFLNVVLYTSGELPLQFACERSGMLDRGEYYDERGVRVKLDVLEHCLPSTPLLVRGHVYHVVRGPFLIYNLIQTFLNHASVWALSFHHRDEIRKSITTFILLIHSIFLIAPQAPALELRPKESGYLSDTEYEAVRQNPAFVEAQPFLRWFTNFRELSQYALNAASYAWTQESGMDRRDGAATLAGLQHSIEMSVVGMQVLLRPLSQGKCDPLDEMYDPVRRVLESGGEALPSEDVPPPYRHNGEEHDFVRPPSRPTTPWRREKTAAPHRSIASDDSRASGNSLAPRPRIWRRSSVSSSSSQR